MAALDYFLDGNIAIFGGQSAHHKMLGFRQLRPSSTDIDCIATEGSIEKIKKEFNSKLFYISKYDCLFFEHNNYPVFISLDHIHDWKITDDFRDSIVRIKTGENSINSCSPEYLIMLKLRRSYTNKKMFGKDRLDIINILLAPLYRDELKHIDIGKTSEFIKKHVTSDDLEMRKYINDIKNVNNLKGEEEIRLSNIHQMLLTYF